MKCLVAQHELANRFGTDLTRHCQTEYPYHDEAALLPAVQLTPPANQQVSHLYPVLEPHNGHSSLITWKVCRALHQSRIHNFVSYLGCNPLES